MEPVVAAAMISGTGLLLNAAYTNRVAARLEERRHARSKAETVAEVMALYRDPLLRASFDLQSRLFNIVQLDFLGKHYGDGREDTTDYARENTLYVIAEYLGWVEILRRGVRFLDLGDEANNQAWAEKLDAVRRAFLSDELDPVFRILNGEQRAIGEVMVVPLEDEDGRAPRLECRGYATFVVRHRDDPDFSVWFTRLAKDLDLLARAPGEHVGRPVALQHALVELIDFLDPDCERLPRADRQKLRKLQPAQTS